MEYPNWLENYQQIPISLVQTFYWDVLMPRLVHSRFNLIKETQMKKKSLNIRCHTPGTRLAQSNAFHTKLGANGTIAREWAHIREVHVMCAVSY